MKKTKDVTYTEGDGMAKKITEKIVDKVKEIVKTPKSGLEVDTPKIEIKQEGE